MANKKKKQNTEAGFLRFLVSKVFLLNIVLAGLAIVLVAWLTLKALQGYSRHGQSQTVPELSGLQTEDARQMLENAGLEYAVMDSTYQVEARPLSVISQDPPAGASVKEGRSVYVVINRKDPPPTEIPYIEEGTSYLSVVEILQSRGLKIGQVTYRPFQYKDVFLAMKVSGESQSLKPGTKVPKGTVVDLILGNGLGDTKVQVPDLRGLTFLEGRALIELKELNLGSVIPEGMIADTLDAFIIRQYPESGLDNYINMGSMIDLWISDTPPETEWEEYEDAEGGVDE